MDVQSASAVAEPSRAAPSCAIRLSGCASPSARSSRSTASTSRSREGEFFTLLGPSGSGKTTLLRMIAGFERPDAGTVELDGVDVTGRPPYERDVNTVFQDYALFPHMSVLENVEYGLRVKRVAQAERATRAAEALEHRAARRTTATAARPALAAASASASRSPARSSTSPRCCCSTSRSARSTSSCARRCSSSSSASSARSAITFVYVTHDQEEALTMSDRIAVINEGRVEQVGTPGEVYEHPATSSSPASSAPRTCSSATAGASRSARRRSACSTDGRAEGATRARQVARRHLPRRVTRYVVASRRRRRSSRVRQNLDTPRRRSAAVTRARRRSRPGAPRRTTAEIQ